ncbi:MAG: hypothetical protein HY904_08625 [Deltaproteobacteria bacterium]|nr:hypothetical protein [Deltaproteobacteria bacterium]
MGAWYLTVVLCAAPVGAVPLDDEEVGPDHAGPSHDDGDDDAPILPPPPPPPPRDETTTGPLVRLAALGLGMTCPSASGLLGCGLGTAAALAAGGLLLVATGFQSGAACVGLLALLAALPVGAVMGLGVYVPLRVFAPYLVPFPPQARLRPASRIRLGSMALAADALVHALAGLGAAVVAAGAAAVATGVSMTILYGASAGVDPVTRAAQGVLWGGVVAVFAAPIAAFLAGCAALLGLLGLVQPVAPFTAVLLDSLLPPATGPASDPYRPAFSLHLPGD